MRAFSRWPISSAIATRPCSTRVIGLTLLGDLQGHRCGVALHGQGGEAVGDHQRQIAAFAGVLVERGGAGVVEASAEVGTLQIDLSV